MDTCTTLGKQQCADHPHTAKESLGKQATSFAGMAARMGHFKLTGSPKWKNYRPRRKFQYIEAATESPSKSVLCTIDARAKVPVL